MIASCPFRSALMANSPPEWPDVNAVRAEVPVRETRPGRSSSPHPDGTVRGWHVDHDQFGRLDRVDLELLRPEDLDGVTGRELVVVAEPRCSRDQVEIAGATVLERVSGLDAGIEEGDLDARVLVNRDDVPA